MEAATRRTRPIAVVWAPEAGFVSGLRVAAGSATPALDRAAGITFGRRHPSVSLNGPATRAER